MDPLQADVETMPRLYRAVLDLAAELESREDVRREAARVRAEAIRTYAAGWSAAHERRLRGLHRQLQAVAAGHAPFTLPHALPGPARPGAGVLRAGPWRSRPKP